MYMYVTHWLKFYYVSMYGLVVALSVYIMYTDDMLVVLMPQNHKQSGSPCVLGGVPDKLCLFSADESLLYLNNRITGLSGNDSFIFYVTVSAISV